MTPRHVYMTPEELRAICARLRLSAAELAVLCSAAPRTVKRWRGGTTAIPGLVADVLRGLDAGRLTYQHLGFDKPNRGVD